MTLNGVIAVTLRYFTEFGKHTFQHVTAASICGGIYARVYLFVAGEVFKNSQAAHTNIPKSRKNPEKKS